MKNFIKKLFPNRLMRSIVYVNFFFIIFIIVGMTITSCCGCDSSAYKYQISDGHSTYFTNDYVIYNGHVSFLADKKLDSTIIGGYYKIETNSSYKPTKSRK